MTMNSTDTAERIRRAEQFLKERLDSGEYMASHPKEKTYRLEHSYRVANIGKEIAQAEGFDVSELVVACLLHDVSYCETFGETGWKEHGRRSAMIARPFLEELGFPKERIQDMCYGIAIHVDDQADFDGERTPFALSVGDADNIDRFDAYRIHESLVHDDFLNMPFDQKQEYVQKRINRLKELMELETGTVAAKRIWQERLSFYLSFYERLDSQLRSSKEIRGM